MVPKKGPVEQLHLVSRAVVSEQHKAPTEKDALHLCKCSWAGTGEDVKGCGRLFVLGHCASAAAVRGGSNGPCQALVIGKGTKQMSSA